MATTQNSAPAKKTAAKKAPARKAPARKAPAKRATAPAAAPAKKPTAMEIARSAARQLAALSGRQPESVIGIERTEDGWDVELEVVESRRIPDSTDILATYLVQVDGDGDLTGYHRVRRYVRGKGGEGDGGSR
ncbi:gas vesicle protein [Nocardioides sp. LS1]|uniref:gas vesicle protein GvpO n=1 Tax=Nocardioides sp. LS1 TaxID=1027620 RepID=UPI000F615F2E|nr:gas vesicle protein [Nocardioides sp. LS1]GCD89269.1 hypothetical protein NLS1_12750 [Nocardioides sp. LS1]